jgi:hypothetical protein
VRVFHDQEDGLLGGDAPQDGEQGMQGLLCLLRGRRLQGDIVSAQWERQEGDQATEGAPTCPRYPWEDMPRSETPGVACVRALRAPRTAAFRPRETGGIPLGMAVRVILLATT